jgi:hypothetical protein
VLTDWVVRFSDTPIADELEYLKNPSCRFVRISDTPIAGQRKYLKNVETDRVLRISENTISLNQGTVRIFQTGYRANFAISPISRASFPKSKERERTTDSVEGTRATARFPVLKGPIRRQTECAKSRLVISHCLINCPTLIPHSSNH